MQSDGKASPLAVQAFKTKNQWRRNSPSLLRRSNRLFHQKLSRNPRMSAKTTGVRVVDAFLPKMERTTRVNALGDSGVAFVI